jgi:hypothetical protein
MTQSGLPHHIIGQERVIPHFTIIEAPSVLGLFPKGVETLPEALLAKGLAERLEARRGERIQPPPYDYRRDRRRLNRSSIRRYFGQGFAAVAPSSADSRCTED